MSVVGLTEVGADSAPVAKVDDRAVFAYIACGLMMGATVLHMHKVIVGVWVRKTTFADLVIRALSASVLHLQDRSPSAYAAWAEMLNLTLICLVLCTDVEIFLELCDSL